MRKILFLFALLVPGIALAAQTQMVRLTRFEGKPIVGVAASGSFNVELIRSDRTYAVVEVNAEYEDILLFELDGRGVVTVGFRTNAPLRFENNLVCRARIYLPHPEFIHGSGAASIVCSGGFESNALQIELNGAAKLNGPEIGVRIDSAVYNGYEVTPYYDSMLAKLIVHGENREEAIKKMISALGEVIVEGIDTNDMVSDADRGGLYYVESYYM